MVDPLYADHARNDFATYVQRTLAYSQADGGRYNPPGEFGAIYTASDEATAWRELHARFAREGIHGLPRQWGLLRILVTDGKFADIRDPAVCLAWGVDPAALIAADPSPAQQEACWQLARDVRAVADFLRAPSARGDGENIPLFIGARPTATLAFRLSGVDTTRTTPDYLWQRPQESWEPEAL